MGRRQATSTLARHVLGYEPRLDAETHAHGRPEGDLGDGLCRLTRARRVTSG